VHLTMKYPEVAKELKADLPLAKGSWPSPTLSPWPFYSSEWSELSLVHGSPCLY
jgi:hypothetical protein